MELVYDSRLQTLTPEQYDQKSVIRISLLAWAILSWRGLEHRLGEQPTVCIITSADGVEVQMTPIAEPTGRDADYTSDRADAGPRGLHNHSWGTSPGRPSPRTFRP